MDSVRVLIVEDQPLVRTGLNLTLAGYADILIVGEADNGLSAVQQCEKLMPDLVLMDIRMPEMDGISATRTIKEKLPGIKVIMLTTYIQDSDIFSAFASGADGYCVKDASPDQLHRAILGVAGGAAWLDSAVAGRVLRANALRPREPVKGQRSATARAAFELSPRELEILGLLVEGMSNQQMADRLLLSHETIKTHMRRIMQKMAVADRTQAAVKAMREGLV